MICLVIYLAVYLPTYCMCLSAYRRTDGTYGRTDGCVYRLTDRRMDGRGTDGRVYIDQRKDGRTDGRIDQRTGGQTYGQTYKQMTGRVDRRINRQSDGATWTDRQTEGLPDERTYGLSHACSWKGHRKTCRFLDFKRLHRQINLTWQFLFSFEVFIRALEKLRRRRSGKPVDSFGKIWNEIRLL